MAAGGVHVRYPMVGGGSLRPKGVQGIRVLWLSTLCAGLFEQCWSADDSCQAALSARQVVAQRALLYYGVTRVSCDTEHCCSIVGSVQGTECGYGTWGQTAPGLVVLLHAVLGCFSCNQCPCVQVAGYNGCCCL